MPKENGEIVRKMYECFESAGDGMRENSTVVCVFDDPIAPIGRRAVGTQLPDEESLGAARDGSRVR